MSNMIFKILIKGEKKNVLFPVFDSQACLNRISAPLPFWSIPGACIHECIRQNRQAKTHRRPHSCTAFLKFRKRITTDVFITNIADYDKPKKDNLNKLHKNQTPLIFFFNPSDESFGEYVA